MNGTRKKNMLSEVTQTQKDKHGMYSLISGFCYKAKNNQLTVYNPKEPRQTKKTPRKEIHGSAYEGEKEKNS